MVGGSTVKEMTMNFEKLDKFEGNDFRRWHKKMHFLLTTLKVVYVLTTPMPELLEDDTVEEIRRREKWENDDYICRGHILNGMSYPLFNIYHNVESAKELWDSLEYKYMAEDDSSKKFLMSNFNNYKMVDSRHVMEQFNELLRILGQYTQHGLKMDESISVSSVIDKLPPSWKNFKHSLKNGKDDLSLVQLGSHLRIEESLRVQESDNGKGKEVAGPSVNMIKEGGKNKNNKQNKGKKHGFKENDGQFKRDCRSGNKKNNANTGGSGKGLMQLSVLYMGDDHFAHIHGKGSVVLEFSYGKSITLFNVLYVPKLRKNLISGPVLNKCGYKQVYESDKIIHETTTPYTPQQNGVAERKNRALKEMVNSMAVVRLPDPKRKTLGEKGIDCIFVGYAEHSKAYTFYVIEPNDSVSINSIIESRDAIFDENDLSSIPRPKDIIPNSDESQRDDHSNDVPSETSEPRRGKKASKAKSYGSDFQLYLVEGSRDQIGSQYSYCYSIKEDPRTYNEAMQSRDAALWKEAY
ncbi:zinc finger, CCHC-type containing protein [Tanacetum coccineum]